MNSKRPTIKDVAEKAGVSTTLVSFVLNDTAGECIPEATREKVLSAIKELGYVPNHIARGMRTKRSNTIGIVSFWDIRNHVFNDILLGINRITEEKGYSILICNHKLPAKEFEYIDIYKRGQVDGLIFICPYDMSMSFDESLHVRSIKENTIPSAILNMHIEAEGVNCIYFDYYNAAYISTEYLIKLGHKKIGYILPHKNEIAQFQAVERFRGYRSALSDYGINILNDYIFHLDKPEDFKDMIYKIKKGESPTALVAGRTRMAQHFLQYALEYGVRVPDEISIIAASTEPYAEFLYPALTTVQLPLEDIGASAANMVIDSINGKKSHVKLKYSYEICERRSCKKV